MKKGYKLICLNDIKNVFGQILFEKDKIYDVLYVDNEKVKTMVCLNHVLYANEYNLFELEWVMTNFKIKK